MLQCEHNVHFHFLLGVNKKLKSERQCIYIHEGGNLPCGPSKYHPSSSNNETIFVNNNAMQHSFHISGLHFKKT